MVDEPNAASQDPSSRISSLFPPDPVPGVIVGGGVSLLAGASGLGKTALLAWMATCFRDGVEIFNRQPVVPPKQAIIVADRSWLQSTRRWFELVGFGDIPHYALLDDPTFPVTRLRKKHERLNILKGCLDRLGDLPFGSLVYVDPMGLFLGGDINNYDACMVACCEIRAVGRERGLTIIGTAHSSKQVADPRKRYMRLQDRIAGSTALFGYTDTQMYLGGPEELGEDFYLFHWAPHHEKAESFQLGRDEQGLFIPYDGTQSMPIPFQDLPALLRLFPEEGEVSLADLALAAHADYTMSIRTVKRHLVKLLADGTIEKVRHGVYRRRKPS